MAENNNLTKDTLDLEILNFIKALTEIQENKNQENFEFLHSNSSAELAALKLQLSLFRLNAEEQGIDVSGLSKSFELIDTIIAGIRKLSHDLYPSIMKTVGLIRTLKWVSEKIALNKSVIVEYEDNSIEESEFSFSTQEQLLIYRIHTEAIDLLLSEARHKSLKISLSEKNNIFYMGFKCKADAKAIPNEDDINTKAINTIIKNIKIKLLLLDAIINEDTDWKTAIYVGIPIKL